MGRTCLVPLLARERQGLACCGKYSSPLCSLFSSLFSFFFYPHIYTHTASLITGPSIRFQTRLDTEAVPFNTDNSMCRMTICILE